MANAADLDRPLPPRRAVGRPRCLTLRQIVQAGVDIGLENLNLTEVALRLGVSVGTIYTYVANRDELVRLIAATLTRRDPVEDRGQHWADMVRCFVDDSVKLLRDAPELLAHIASGAIEPGEELPEMEAFVALMVSRGFAPEVALTVYQGCGQIAIGAAMRAAMTQSIERRGKRRSLYLAEILAERGAEFPELSRLTTMLVDTQGYLDHRPALERLLAQVAAEHGETLPLPQIDGGEYGRGVGGQ